MFRKTYFQIPKSIVDEIQIMRENAAQVIEAKRDKAIIYKYHAIALVPNAMTVKMEHGVSKTIQYANKIWNLSEYKLSKEDQKLFICPNKVNDFKRYIQDHEEFKLTMYHAYGCEGFDHDVIQVKDSQGQLENDFTYHRY
jgi:hypothetical protein